MAEDTNRRRILVVDDEERMVRFIRMNLEHDGYQVDEAFNGKQAIDRLPGGVTLHGVAFNREPSLAWYARMTACGAPAAPAATTAPVCAHPWGRWHPF